MIKCMIIDDEPSSQNVLKEFVGRLGFLELVCICNDALEALNFLKSNSVDLLFLDINMPQLSGLSFYKSLQNPPLVIFTTAYSEYALDGFEVNATDYLLKPFSFDRFVTAIKKVRKALTETKKNLIIKSDKKLHQIKFDDILFVEAMGDYIKVHTNNKKLVSYNTLLKLVPLLPKNKFVQVHKSYIINQSKIDYIEGNQVIIQEFKISLGQKFKKDFLQKINR